MANGRWACEPIDVATAAGSSPSAAVNEVMTTGRTLNSAPRRTDSRTLHPAARIFDLALRLGDRGGQVTVLNAELDRDVAAVVFTINVGGPWFVGLDLRELGEGNSHPRMVDGSWRVDRDVADHFGIVAHVVR